jgi:hypothetical protein
MNLLIINTILLFAGIVRCFMVGAAKWFSILFIGFGLAGTARAGDIGIIKVNKACTIGAMTGLEQSGVAEVFTMDKKTKLGTVRASALPVQLKEPGTYLLDFHGEGDVNDLTNYDIFIEIQCATTKPGSNLKPAAYTCEIKAPESMSMLKKIERKKEFQVTDKGWKKKDVEAPGAGTLGKGFYNGDANAPNCLLDVKFK